MKKMGENNAAKGWRWASTQKGGGKDRGLTVWTKKRISIKGKKGPRRGERKK